MTIPSFQWIETSPTGILVTEDANPANSAWHSGRVIDVLHLGSDRLLVGTATGGVWIADLDGKAHPIGDGWAFPDVLCLFERRRPGVSTTYLCGTRGGLFQSPADDPTKPGTWRSLNLPHVVTEVRRIATVHDGRRVVIATNRGIWWTTDTDADFVHWTQARWRRPNGTVIPLEGQWSGLACTGLEQLAAGTLQNAPRYLSLGGEIRFQPLLFGEVEATGFLVFSGAMLTGAPQDELSAMRSISLASCESDKKFVYAATFHDQPALMGSKIGSGQRGLLRVLRSNDQGRSWVPAGYGLEGPVHDGYIDLRSKMGDAANGGSLKNLTVHPKNPNNVAIAGLLGFISKNAGNTWIPIGAEWSNKDENGVYQSVDVTPPHLHHDFHTIIFAPSDAEPERVFGTNDGGVFRAGDWSKIETFSTMYNRGLRTLQFYSPSADWEYRGSSTSTASNGGIAAGGLQDNGNVWKQNHVAGTWRKSEWGDGGFSLALGPNRYFHQNLDDDPTGPDGAVWVQRWSGADNLDQAVQVPHKDEAGNVLAPFLEIAIEPVRNPAFRDENGRLLHAIGWYRLKPGQSPTDVPNKYRGKLFGLFADDDADNAFWMTVWSSPPPIEVIVSASSHDGNEVLLGTEANRLFRLDTASKNLTQMAVIGLPDVNYRGGPLARPPVNRVIALRDAKAFATFFGNNGDVALIARRRDFDTWERVTPPLDPLRMGDTPGTVYGMDVDDLDPAREPLLVVATESRVWASDDRGDTWKDVSDGLPQQPHCRDVRFNRFKQRWTLSTWGRSQWQSGALVQVGVSSLIQSDFVKGAAHHNFEALVLIGEDLFHYVKDNRDVAASWKRIERFPARVSAPACIIRSDYEKGADHHNFEALVLEGDRLWHWFRDNKAGQPWARVGLVNTLEADRVVGPASMVQGDYRQDGDHGNFEALVPMSDGLWHWYRNNATGEWFKVSRINAIPGSTGCIATSDYKNEPGHRALEALVFEPHGLPLTTGNLWHYFWRPSDAKWIATSNLTSVALGPASFIQGSFVQGTDHKNLEALLWISHGYQIIQHWFRRDDIGSLDWDTGQLISARAQGPGSLIQSDFHSEGNHGNFEAIFPELDNEVWHYFRPQSAQPWKIGGGTVT